LKTDPSGESGDKPLFPGAPDVDPRYPVGT
jgi:hypothetical protein